MAWTTPKTNWATGELVTAEDMNTVGENFAALKHQEMASYQSAMPSDNPLQFAEADPNNLNLTITTAGGDILVHFDCTLSSNSNTYGAVVSFDFEIDGSRQGHDINGIAYVTVPAGRTTYSNVSISRVIQNLSAGMHTVKLVWRYDSHRQIAGGRLHQSAFWVREI